MYCEVRLQLMAGTTQAQIQQHAKEPLPVQTRVGWATLMQVPKATERIWYTTTVLTTASLKALNMLLPLRSTITSSTSGKDLSHTGGAPLLG